MIKKFRYLLLSYILLAALFYAYQHLWYFQPKALDAKHAFTFPARLKFSTSNIPFDANTDVDVVKFNSDDTTRPAKGVVLFFHGNRFNVEHYSTYAPYFTKNGYEVWMPDYPGYGRSKGEIEMNILDELSEQLYQMARVHYKPEEIIIYGKSLGTGVASYLASVRDCKSLVLETPYYSLSSLTQSYLYFLPIPWLIRYNLRTGEYFKDIKAPITVIEGTRDELIPLENTLRLVPLMKEHDALYLIKEGKHNDLPSYTTYQNTIDSILLN